MVTLMEIKTFVSKAMGENCYGVAVGNEAFLVDPGEFNFELEEYAIKNAEKIKYIFLTHCHFDHVLALSELLKILKNSKIVIHSNDAEGLTNSKINLSYFFGGAEPNVKADILANDGDEFTVGGEKIKVILTKGHTVGSVCYKIGDILFSGDTLFKESYGRTDFPGGNFGEISASIGMLMKLDEETKVYSGHGAVTTIGYEKENNPILKGVI